MEIRNLKLDTSSYFLGGAFHLSRFKPALPALARLPLQILQFLYY